MRFHKKNVIITCCVTSVFFYLIFFNNNWEYSTNDKLGKLQKSIVETSQKYVHLLAMSQQNVEDGPAAYPATAYNMKKTLGVLLDFMNSEIKELQRRIEMLENNTNCKPKIEHVTKPSLIESNKEFIGVVDLIQSRQDICKFPSFDGWPHCSQKIAWMRDMWKSDECYADWGVDGTDCSFLIYLSEHEKFCPPFPWRVNKTIEEEKKQVYQYATVKTDMSGLLNLLQKKDEQYKWLRLRISRMQNKWLNAVKKLEKRFNLSSRRKMRVLFHMGLLNEETGWDIAKNAFSGGPLGELVQWTDLMSAVYALGHEVSVTTHWKELNDIFHPYLASASSNCPLKSKPFDIIYTDITGLKVFKSLTKQRFHLLECNIRVLDSFGTEPEYNVKHYSKRKMHKGGWGNLELNPKQFFTMFPHTPDNTFLGFVVEEHLNDDIANNQSFAKENIALVYGKRDDFWKDKSAFLSVIHEFIDIHATVDKSNELKYVPDYVINHGVLPGDQLHALLKKTKLFIGLGFPYEGPAPLEAIANGAVFLNPKFNQPLNYKNTKFFEGKPTSRALTSQHPYSEIYIGNPFVKTVDMNNLEMVRETVREVLRKDIFKTYLPHEFTCEGMLERLSFYIEKQDFCTGSVIPIWPPVSALTIKISDSSQTCNDVCVASGKICEPSYFPVINKKSIFKQLGVDCSEFFSPQAESGNTEIDHPAFLNYKCFLQTENLLFSCAGRYTNYNRICPCRDYIKGQIALCKDCLV